MSGLAGTGALARLWLRRDRVRIATCVLAFILVVLAPRRA